MLLRLTTTTINTDGTFRWKVVDFPFNNVFISAIIIMTALFEQLLADAEMGVGLRLWLSQTWCFPDDPHSVVVCYDCREQTCTFIHLFTVQWWILPNSGRDHEGSNLCDNTRFPFLHSYPVISRRRLIIVWKPDKLFHYHGKMRWLYSDLEITEF